MDWCKWRLEHATLAIRGETLGLRILVAILKPMTDDPSSPSKKLVRETWSNLCTQDTQESHTSNMASDDSDEDALAVILMVTALEESKKVKK